MKVPSHTSDLLKNAHITHGFFTRQGGVSGGVYASLNCGPGSGDDRANVIENRRRVAAALSFTPSPFRGRVGEGVAGGGIDPLLDPPPEGGGNMPPLLTCSQVHGAVVVTVREPWEVGDAPQADGLVTDQTGIILGVLTADCAPVLFADAEAGVIGAAHVGWKGAHRGILAATVEAMLALGAQRERMLAAIGPAIAQSSYEVEGDVRGIVLAEAAENARFFVPNAAGRWQFDLTSYVVATLAASFVTHINLLARDTFSEKDAFFSYRRTAKAGEPDYGRQVSSIMLREQ